jgi:hypothetical protein
MSPATFRDQRRGGAPCFPSSCGCRTLRTGFNPEVQNAESRRVQAKREGVLTSSLTVSLVSGGCVVAGNCNRVSHVDPRTGAWVIDQSGVVNRSL